jgi:hypothetical protein
MFGAVVGVVLLVAGYNDSHSCTLYPTSSPCHSATPFEVIGLLLVIVGVLAVVGIVRSRR